MTAAVATLLAEHETWLAVERGLSVNTVAAYRRDLAHYARFLAERGIGGAAEVTPATVAGFVDQLRGAVDDDGRPRYRPASVARMVVAVRSFHGFCLMEGHTPTDPSEDIGAPRVPQGIPKALTEAEVTALLDGVPGDDPVACRDRAMLEVLYGTGLRISELVGLNLGDLDLDEGFLRAFGKGAKERVVPVGRTATAALSTWLAARRGVIADAGRPDLDAVFVNPRGRRMTRQGAWQIIQRHGLRAGLGGRLSPHVLRHSCATHMVEHGADLRVVQELLGHASVSTTQVYTKVTQSRLRAVYDTAHPRSGLVRSAHGSSAGASSRVPGAPTPEPPEQAPVH